MLIDEYLDLPALLGKPYINNRYAMYEPNIQIHEAAHVVVMDLVHGQPSKARVFDRGDGQQFGVAQRQDTDLSGDAHELPQGVVPRNDIMLKAMIESVSVYMAGYAAEIIASDLADNYGLCDSEMGGWYRICLKLGDEVVAVQLSSIMAGISFKDIAVPAWLLTMGILKDHWAKVEQVASEIVIEYPDSEIESYFARRWEEAQAGKYKA